MMGTRHALAGVLAATVTAPLAALADPAPHPVLWVAGWVAGGMLPDFDHPNAHPSRVWGPVTQGMAWLVGRASGGHRESTHDVVVAPAVTVAWTSLLIGGMGWLEGLHWSFGFVALVCLALPFGVALRMAGGPFGNAVVNLPAAVGLALWLLASPGAVSWFPLILAGGIVVHILCDSVTSEGAPVPLVWIWDKGRGRKRQWGARLFPVGSLPEVSFSVVFPAVTVAVAAAYLASGVVAAPTPGLPDIGLAVPHIDRPGWGSIEDLGRWMEGLSGQAAGVR